MDSVVEQIKKLEMKIALEQDDIKKVGLLSNLQLFMAQVDHEKSAVIAEEAYALALKTGDRGAIGKGLVLLAEVKIAESKPDVALPYLVEAREAVAGDKAMESHVLIAIARVYSHMSRIDTSIEYSIEGLNLAIESGDKYIEAMVRANLSIEYHKLAYAEPAIDHALKSLAISEEINDTYGCAHVLSILGTIWGEFHRDYHKAIEYFQQGLQITDRYGHMPIGTLLMINIAETYMRLGEPDKAKGYLVQAEEKLRPLYQYRNILAHCLAVRGMNEQAASNYPQALQYAREALSIADEMERKDQQYQMHELLSHCYRQLGELEKALVHYQQFHQIKEDLFNEESQKKIRALTVQYDVERAKSEKELAEKEREIVRLKNEELSAALEEVQALNARLVEMNTEKNEMLGIVAHDLKSPLAGIRMVSSLLKQHYQRMSGDELLRQLGDVEQTSDRILQIVNNLLNVHAIESDTVYTAEEHMNVSAEVEQIAHSYIAEADRKGIALRLECDKPLWLQGSRDALQQAVENLVSNALKFSPAGKNIWLRVRQSDGSIQIEVEDEGPGIKAEDQEKMFEKYGRLSARPTGGEGSTGLGLWIVRKSVDVLRGSIHCHSEVGRGTKFVVEIPVVTPAV